MSNPNIVVPAIVVTALVGGIGSLALSHGSNLAMVTGAVAGGGSVPLAIAAVRNGVDAYRRLVYGSPVPRDLDSDTIDPFSAQNCPRVYNAMLQGSEISARIAFNNDDITHPILVRENQGDEPVKIPSAYVPAQLSVDMADRHRYYAPHTFRLRNPDATPDELDRDLAESSSAPAEETPLLEPPTPEGLRSASGALRAALSPSAQGAEPPRLFGAEFTGTVNVKYDPDLYGGYGGYEFSHETFINKNGVTLKFDDPKLLQAANDGVDYRNASDEESRRREKIKQIQHLRKVSKDTPELFMQTDARGEILRLAARSDSAEQQIAGPSSVMSGALRSASEELASRPASRASSKRALSPGGQGRS